MVYILRVNISVAAQNMRDELDWSENQKGLVLVSRPLTSTLDLIDAQSSFYWGYALGQIPASRLVQMYGAKWVFGLRYPPPPFSLLCSDSTNWLLVCSYRLH